MVWQGEAVFEHGVLRPLEPLALAEQQHVQIVIRDAEPPDATPPEEEAGLRRAEREWFRAHGAEYRGEWLALQGDGMISHGEDLRTVRNEARAKGVQHPLLVHVPEDFGQPSLGFF